VQKREPQVAWSCRGEGFVAILFAAKKQRLSVKRRTPKKQEGKKGVVGSEARRQKYEYSGLPQTLPHNTQGRDAKETSDSLFFFLCFCAQKPEQRRSRSVSRRLTRTSTCGLGNRFGDQGEGTRSRFHRANWIGSVAGSAGLFASVTGQKAAVDNVDLWSKGLRGGKGQERRRGSEAKGRGGGSTRRRGGRMEDKGE
ncbi:hypothetical protein CCMA1212_000367, partial [Trichoderma ghanense]